MVRRIEHQMEIIMFRKYLAAALTVAIVAGSAVTAPTTASAANGRNFAAVAGLIAGAAIATAASSGPTYVNADRGYAYSDRGHGGCFEKEFVRWNGYGERIVTYKTFCR
jgi:hypothetical protein